MFKHLDRTYYFSIKSYQLAVSCWLPFIEGIEHHRVEELVLVDVNMFVTAQLLDTWVWLSRFIVTTA